MTVVRLRYPLFLLLFLLAAVPVWGPTASHLPTAALEVFGGVPPLGEDEEPVVLIYHTHGSEGFFPDLETNPDGVSGWDRDGDGQPEALTRRTELSVVAAGRRLAKELAARGYPVLHLRTVFDYPRVEGAYDRARARVQAVLEQHPEIRIVIDLHRDAPNRSETVGSVNGKPTARILFVLGRHSGMELNRHLVDSAVLELVRRYPDLNRGIRLLDFHYNQDLHQGALLVEIGGADATLDEVKRAALPLAEILTAVMEKDQALSDLQKR